MQSSSSSITTERKRPREDDAAAAVSAIGQADLPPSNEYSQYQYKYQDQPIMAPPPPVPDGAYYGGAMTYYAAAPPPGWGWPMPDYNTSFSLGAARNA